jgi:hypothetical protein
MCRPAPNSSTPTGTQIDVALSKDITVSTFFGTLGSTSDCSNVDGCNKKDCNLCIKQYWSAASDECTPSCGNESPAATRSQCQKENKELKKAVAVQQKELEELRAAVSAMPLSARGSL